MELQRATAPDTCAVTEFKCLVIKSVGQQAYSDAASYREPPGFVKIVPDIDGIQDEFEQLYQECPQVMLSIKSCSLIANICLGKNDENCEQNLTKCVQQAADLQDTQQCWQAISQAQVSLEESKKQNRQRVRRDIPAENEPTTLAFTPDPSQPSSTHQLSSTPQDTSDSTPGPFTYQFAIFVAVMIFLVVLAFYLNFKRNPDRWERSENRAKVESPRSDSMKS